MFISFFIKIPLCPKRAKPPTRVKMMSGILRPRSFYYLLHPRPVVVIVTLCEGGKANAMPASWVTPVSEEPTALAVAIDKENYTFTCIEYSKEATFNIPSQEHVNIVYGLGTVSGRAVDKVRMFNLRLGKANKVAAPIWLDAIGWIEGRVMNRVDVGETALYIFEVLDYYAKPDAVSEWGWKFDKASPLHHGSGRGFHTVGKLILASKTKQ
ncbi:MAG: flavin reductase family protein [Ignisphaera sp.]|jgi:flavin reductase (DIM6/NTAB) family NADH-FMN oxidoreductase RutF|nr:flavin reductase family protein [Ignisphaera sp.]MCC6055440.1 flavin reductase family protein [Desulfurococcaceae archaeon]